MWIIQLPLHVGITLGALYIYTEVFFFFFYSFFYKKSWRYKVEFLISIVVFIVLVDFCIFGSLNFDLHLFEFFNRIVISSRTFTFEGLKILLYDFFYLFSLFDGDFIRLILNCILRY